MKPISLLELRPRHFHRNFFIWNFIFFLHKSSFFCCHKRSSNYFRRMFLTQEKQVFLMQVTFLTVNRHVTCHMSDQIFLIKITWNLQFCWNYDFLIRQKKPNPQVYQTVMLSIVRHIVRFPLCLKIFYLKYLTLTRPLRKKFWISGDSSLIWQKIGTFFI